MSDRQRRAIVIIIDGVGIGAMPDAGLYNDWGANTLQNLAKKMGGLNLPNLEMLGLGKIIPISGVNADIRAVGAYGKMAEKSPGKDSPTGHWELAGYILDKPFPTYPNGFPDEIINLFIKKTGLEILGNIPASGTEIINEMGEEHIQTGKPIVYTSADSVFQIAANEQVIPLKKLYEICRIARDILKGEHAVARVIARPFVGTSPKNFQRTKARKDFSLKPEKPTLLQNLMKAGINTVGVGKINELYANVGISKIVSARTNKAGMAAVLNEINETASGLIMVNMEDFDMLWGRRNDSPGFYRELKEFDASLPILMNKLKADDIVIITADHGNDPTTASTDHSREYVPILVFGAMVKANIDVGTRATFADLQATLAEYFMIASTGCGESFLSLMQRQSIGKRIIGA